MNRKAMNWGIVAFFANVRALAILTALLLYARLNTIPVYAMGLTSGSYTSGKAKAVLATSSAISSLALPGLPDFGAIFDSLLYNLNLAWGTTVYGFNAVLQIAGYIMVRLSEILSGPIMGSLFDKIIHTIQENGFYSAFYYLALLAAVLTLLGVSFGIQLADLRKWLLWAVVVVLSLASGSLVVQTLETMRMDLGHAIQNGTETIFADAVARAGGLASIAGGGVPTGGATVLDMAFNALGARPYETSGVPESVRLQIDPAPMPVKDIDDAQERQFYLEQQVEAISRLQAVIPLSIATVFQGFVDLIFSIAAGMVLLSFPVVIIFSGFSSLEVAAVAVVRQYVNVFKAYIVVSAFLGLGVAIVRAVGGSGNLFAVAAVSILYIIYQVFFGIRPGMETLQGSFAAIGQQVGGLAGVSNPIGGFVGALGNAAAASATIGTSGALGATGAVIANVGLATGNTAMMGIGQGMRKAGLVAAGAASQRLGKVGKIAESAAQISSMTGGSMLDALKVADSSTAFLIGAQAGDSPFRLAYTLARNSGSRMPPGTDPFSPYTPYINDLRLSKGKKAVEDSSRAAEIFFSNLPNYGTSNDPATLYKLLRDKNGRISLDDERHAQALVNVVKNTDPSLAKRLSRSKALRRATMAYLANRHILQQQAIQRQQLGQVMQEIMKNNPSAGTGELAAALNTEPTMLGANEPHLAAIMDAVRTGQISLEDLPRVMGGDTSGLDEVLQGHVAVLPETLTYRSYPVVGQSGSDGGEGGEEVGDVMSGGGGPAGEGPAGSGGAPAFTPASPSPVPFVDSSAVTGTEAGSAVGDFTDAAAVYGVADDLYDL